MTIRKTDWQTDKAILTGIRHEVFVDEQAVPIELELDEHDPYCHHWLALLNDEAVGTVRMLNNGSIGRMAVRKDFRKRGIGKALLQAAMEYAKNQDWRELTLGAQDHAIGFYAAAGFMPYGDMFMDAGIPHQSMRLLLREQRRLGQDSQKFKPNDNAATILDMCSQARRTISIFSHALEPDLYASDAMAHALSGLARGHRQNKIRLLISDETSLRENRNPIIELSQRLPSAMSLRLLSADYRAEVDEFFMLVDRSGIFVYTDGKHQANWGSYHLPPQVNDYQERFDRMWERAERPRYLRKLY
ncbi:GNAT family N-acetyltransferase [Zhongshania aliphaticivorans]|uniref:GNAT family N-acetyltransferase n=1 Tax=Zhongshania aliphaticivorans TaxID=1470434 RepID=UPI0012E5D92E|nr:GNAT family N-acetyltransferase [Zhongshania aliphaticivorans]CAA0119203.1 Acetyltransferase [Zhongshania aliphaticivorans]